MSEEMNTILFYLLLHSNHVEIKKIIVKRSQAEITIIIK